MGTLFLPDAPGVYLFKDSHATILYIGKAKSLKKRVASYFLKQSGDWKVAELIKQHASVEYIVTYNESEALLLEAQLIREYQPKFNVLLKNNNPFVYLAFSFGDNPGLSLVRSNKPKKDFVYIGPFLQKKDIRQLYFYLLKLFRLKKCTVKREGGCFDYHLGNCPGSCRSDFNQEDYRIRLALARDAIEGDKASFKKSLEEKMQKYSAEFEFEKAKKIYEYLQNIESIFSLLKSKYTEKKYDQQVALASMPHIYSAQRTSSAGKYIQELLRLEIIPHSIDCFDISHFQGNEIVGSCVRFLEGSPAQSKFRRFKIRSLENQNDYAALQEIVARRYRHGDYPDLMIIDGGKGQLSAVLQVVPATVACVSLAKKEELLFVPHQSQGIPVDVHTEGGRLIIALRDYAHHFAISYHRRLRAKKFLV